MSNRRVTTPILAAVALVVTFIAGGVVGGVLHRGMMLRGGDGDRSAAFLMKRLDRRLDLTPQQEAAVTAILARGRQRIRAVWSGVAPQVQREIERTNAEIDAVLTPQQRTKFTEIKMKMQSRRDGTGLRLRHD